jgi:hypothetical protein
VYKTYFRCLQYASCIYNVIQVRAYDRLALQMISYIYIYIYIYNPGAGIRPVGSAGPERLGEEAAAAGEEEGSQGESDTSGARRERK